MRLRICEVLQKVSADRFIHEEHCMDNRPHSDNLVHIGSVPICGLMIVIEQH